MKVLMIGLGSIGQRHLRNLFRVLEEAPEVLAYRVRRDPKVFSDDLQVLQGEDVESKYGITVFTDLEEALAKKPEAVFITNVTSAHMEAALAACKAGCDLFIEKPLSDS
ncbi:MAG: Gfo/Idh/MocA family oxidoreductase, partial [Lachnospiraceae bacterium]|nr:Gfo/Idh/MocA family oxidoreductase [Lachnospiraceae bacterium]